jgi:hypothetical protein
MIDLGGWVIKSILMEGIVGNNSLALTAFFGTLVSGHGYMIFSGKYIVELCFLTFMPSEGMTNEQGKL